MNMKHALSIVLTSYNYAHFIGEAISSVVRQTSPEWNLIIFDNCSTDDTMKVIEPFLSDPRISLVVRETNIGARRNHIAALNSIDTEYVATLQADDYLDPSFVEKTLEMFRAYPASPFVFFDWYYYLDDTKQTLHNFRLPFSPTRSGLLRIGPYLTVCNFVPMHMAAFNTKCLLSQLDRLNDSPLTQVGEQYLLKVLEDAHGLGCYSGCVGGVWRRHSSQLTADHMATSLANIEEIIERHWYATRSPKPDPATAFLALAAFATLSSHASYVDGVEWMLTPTGINYGRSYNIPIEEAGGHYRDMALSVALKFLTYTSIHLVDANGLASWMRRIGYPLTPDAIAKKLERVREKEGDVFLLPREIDDILIKLRELNHFTQVLRRITVYSGESELNACSQIRLRQPFRLLANNFEINWVDANRSSEHVAWDATQAASADLVVIQRLPHDMRPSDFQALLDTECILILELDDFLLAQSRFTQDAAEYQYMVSVIERVDAVIVSTEVLAKEIQAVARPREVVVLPSAVDAAPMMRVPKLRHGPARLVFISGHARDDDYVIVDAAIDKVMMKYGRRVMLVFIGYTPRQWLNHPLVTSIDYVSDYQLYIKTLPRFELDILIEPLQDTAYNRCKSNIKWLECSTAGIAGIYSDLPPYSEVAHGETGLKVENTTAAWFNAICDLIDHPQKCLDIAKAAQASVLGKHSVDLRAPMYADVYGKFLGKHPTIEGTEVAKALDDQDASQDFYALWKLGHSYLKRDALWISERMLEFKANPRFHMACIVPEGAESLLANNIKSLGSQFYSVWRFTIVAATPPHPALTGIDNIDWIQAPVDAHLVAVNDALSRAEADWVGMLEAGDKLAPHALFTFANHAERKPDLQALYSDEDRVDAQNEHTSPFFKTDFNLEMLRAAPFAVGGLFLLKRERFISLGGYDPAMEGVESLDLVLRTWETAGTAAIGHIADILYHRHVEGGHCQVNPEIVAARHRNAVAAHLRRLNVVATLDDGLLPGTLHVRYAVSGNPLVSILIPTKNRTELLKRCITSLVDGTRYANCEVIILDNGSDEVEAIAFLNDLRALNSSSLRVLDCPGPFNYSAMNNMGARAAKGDFLLLLNNDTAVLHDDWLDEMLGIACQDGVGAVGAKLFYPHGDIQHAGVILGMNDAAADHPFIDHPADYDGYYGRAKLTQEYSAITAACMLLRKSVYLDIGGLNEKSYPVSYNDADICLRLLQKGYRNVFTPYAKLLHEGSASQLGNLDRQRFDAEQNRFYDSWRQMVAFDPSFNRNLSSHGRDFLIEISPALAWDPAWRPRPRVLAHPADRFGCGEYRIIAPMRALNDEGNIMGWETGNYLSPPELFRMEPDVIVLQRQVDPHQLEFIERYIRHSQAFRVYEIDDLITNIPIKSIRKKHFVEQKDLHKRFRKGVSMCDRFVVSTDYLAEQYKGYNDDIVVVPNYLERIRWGDLKPNRRGTAKARVGWAGSVTHDGDLAVIFDVVKTTAKEVDWVFFGMCPEPIRPYVAEYHPGVKLEEYPAKLASLDLDLAVAPLEDVPFNHGKSHLRLLEYGILGFPVICTDLTPYRGDYPVTRVANRFKDWLEAIREHVAERDALAKRGDALREYMRAHWILEDHRDVWLVAWLP